MITTTVQFNSTLLQKYDQSLLRYTSYASVPKLLADFSKVGYAIAQQNGTFHRSFQSYTTQSQTELIALKIIGISL